MRNVWEDLERVYVLAIGLQGQMKQEQKYGVKLHCAANQRAASDPVAGAWLIWLVGSTRIHVRSCDIDIGSHTARRARYDTVDIY